MPIALSFVLLGMVLLAAGARAEQYRIAPEPAWVTKVAAPAHTTPGATASGDVYRVLADVQVHRAIDPPETYQHYAAQAVNELGVPEVSQLAVSFNPAYETLLLHEATIHRGDVELPIPIRGHVKILHREDRLEDQIYDGMLTAVLLVEDVRAGDVVEWSFTLRGANPVLGSHYATSWATNFTTPLALLHRRLLWPAARTLVVRSLGAAVMPTVTRRGDVVEYELLLRDVPRIEVEPDVPGWHDPLRPIILTGAGSWEDVARWGETLFQVPATLTPGMQARIAEFRRAGRFPEEQAMVAVRFVQSEIRYLGIEIGENSHRATAPDVVLSRRFGDCKDKALLLVTFLRALGFEAQPALVNTMLRDSLVRYDPSAALFDHVIVRTRSGGKVYWIDATDTGQRGDVFARMSPPQFGVALVLSDSTRGLSPIVPDGTLALITIEKKIEAASVDDPATMTIRTDYYGDKAVATRLQVRGAGREELTRLYLEYYRRLYPKILELQPLLVEDDEALNHLRVVESYSIPGFWQKEEGEDEPYADVSAIELASEIPSWRGAHREMPLGLAFPHRTIYTASIDTPFDMEDDREDQTIRTPAQVLITRKISGARRFSIYHDFSGSRDHLTAEETNGAVEDFAKMELALATEISRQSTLAGAGGASVLPSIMALMAAMLTLLLMVRIYRAPAPATIWPHTNYAAGSEPWTTDRPIGGWLYLAALGVVMSPFLALYGLGTTLVAAGDIVGLGLTGKNATYEIVGLVETALASAAFVYCIGLLVLFFKRRRVYFRAYVGGVALSMVILVFDLVALQIVSPGDVQWSGQVTELVRGLVSFVIWSLYFAGSRRVEATFVH